MKRFGLLAWMWVALAAVGCYSTERYEQYNVANQAMTVDDLDSAIRGYSRVLLKDSTMAEAHNNRGNAWQYRDSLYAALDDYGSVIFNWPETPEGFFNRAKARQKLGQWEMALADYKAALLLFRENSSEEDLETIDDPNFPWEFTTMEFVKTPYGRAVKEALLYSGVLYRLSWDYDEAIWHISYSLRFDPCESESYLQRSYCYEAMAVSDQEGKADSLYSLALADLTMADSLIDDTGLVRNLMYHKGNCLLGLRRNWEARIVFDTLLAHFPDQSNYYFKAGNCQQALGMYRDAVYSYTGAIDFDSTYADAFFDRANCLYLLGAVDSAAADYSSVVSLVPQFSGGFFMRAVVRRRLHDLDGAMADFQRAGELGHPQGFVELGRLAQQRDSLVGRL